MLVGKPTEYGIFAQSQNQESKTDFIMHLLLVTLEMEGASVGTNQNVIKKSRL